LKCDGTRTETRFRLSAKRMSPFKSAGASVQSTTGSRGVRISGSNAGYIVFRGSVKSTGYPLHSPVSPSIPLPCVTVCHHISTELYQMTCSPRARSWKAKLIKERKHCARANTRFTSALKTSALTSYERTAHTANVFETVITLPGRSEVSLVATTPCQLQLCTVSGSIASR
jgi:hypothetical protein